MGLRLLLDLNGTRKLKYFPEVLEYDNKENAGDNKDGHKEQTCEFELKYRGYCAGACEAKPTDDFANFMCSMQYGFFKRDMAFPVVDVTDQTWGGGPSPAQRKCDFMQTATAKPLAVHDK